MKRPVLKRLGIHRFRSIREASVEFDNPTFLVGRNGAGKSNLVDALAFLSESMVIPVRSAVEYRGGFESVSNQTPQTIPFPAELVRASSVGFDVEFGALSEEIDGARYQAQLHSGARHTFEVSEENCEVRRSDGSAYGFGRRRTDFKSDVTGLNPAIEPSSLALPVIGGDTRFAPVLRALSGIRVYHMQPGGLRFPRDAGGGGHLRCDGTNFASVYEEIARTAPDSLMRMTEFLAQILPGAAKVRPIDSAEGWTVEVEQHVGNGRALRFDSSKLSDGTLRMLALLAAAFQSDPPSVMVIEEPEASLHPGALGVVLDLIRLAAKRMQVIVTTHSPELLDAKWIEERHLRVVSWNAGATHIGGPGEAARGALRDHLMGAGELLRSNALDESISGTNDAQEPLSLSLNPE